MKKNYRVDGMTCQHCVASVTEELLELPSTQGVDVDLETGRVIVTGEDFTDAEVKAAVEEAGFTLRED
ncbi:heavy-metal-associated domain-containing protein [Corynebacterium belfantii]|uniref:Heavy-metal-associated domain-containing protein n=1 Tax=Corynebacterium belfantii TaxID=2014537 RepID=A0ABS0LD22_9CORY|nr:heavy-metal-associated domain-containing protein [Corynebacterium belfantii]OLN15246.1 transporter [Corynebacterium diphtheriae] [Corynebacterium diphtheriae subsp. lausannense]QVI99468.1 heavy-metal-associated domain-containing protein [Corynebacterium diphtheriae]MBG9244659.1 heavy-metal-associated domain-containing protein [Corynebacterium belfantii]MBG9258920.1 heavy-metal-associated domain-containing protein [Corynebacterium belfantii]MBG9265662.1 heavy-metal-associated domain-containi